MEPTFRQGDMVLASGFPYIFSQPNLGDIVILKRGKYIIKRIMRISAGQYFVEGENKKESTDSRNFGWVSKKEILAKVIFRI